MILENLDFQCFVIEKVHQRLHMMKIDNELIAQRSRSLSSRLHCKDNGIAAMRSPVEVVIPKFLLGFGAIEANASLKIACTNLASAPHLKNQLVFSKAKAVKKSIEKEVADP